MNYTGIITLLLIALNVIISYRGFQNRFFMDRYMFEVEKILVYKDYKRLVTSGFFHVNWMHLIFNMFSLYVFSGSVEASLGWVSFLLIYFAGVIGGNLFSLFVHRNDSGYSSVGASGAVFAIIFASIALFPGMKIGLFLIPISFPAWIFGLAFVLFSIYAIKSKRNNIGYDAHLAGAITGLLVAVILHPSSIIENYLPILVVAVPAIAFIYIIITRPHVLLIDDYYFNKHKKNITIDQKYNVQKYEAEKELDRILDKINKKGMASLTSKERRTLEEFSEKK